MTVVARSLLQITPPRDEMGLHLRRRSSAPRDWRPNPRKRELASRVLEMFAWLAIDHPALPGGGLPMFGTGGVDALCVESAFCRRAGGCGILMPAVDTDCEWHPSSPTGNGAVGRGLDRSTAILQLPLCRFLKQTRARQTRTPSRGALRFRVRAPIASPQRSGRDVLRAVRRDSVPAGETPDHGSLSQLRAVRRVIILKLCP